MPDRLFICLSSSYGADNLKFFLDCLYDLNLVIVDATVEVLSKISKFSKVRQSLLASGAISSLEDIGSSPDVSEATRALIDATIKTLRSSSNGSSNGAASSKSSSASSSSAAVIPPAKKEVRGVHLNMDGLLGKKEQEDQYIRALLLVDGVTSVTIDRTRSIAIVYTTEEKEMKPVLYAKVQQVCDGIRDSLGFKRINVTKNDHATYLDDDDEDDDESGDENDDEEDFFSQGAYNKQKLVTVNKGGPNAFKPAVKTAEERMREKDAKTAAPAAQQSSRGGLLSWFGW